MVEEATTKKRQRAGTWTRFQRTTAIEGVLGECPVDLVEVTYCGHKWEVPDTPAGRQIAAEGIKAVQEQEALLTKMDRALGILTDVQVKHDNDLMAIVVASLKDAIEDLRNKIHG